MQNFGVTNKEHYGMLWYFLEWSIEGIDPAESQLNNASVNSTCAQLPPPNPLFGLTPGH